MCSLKTMATKKNKSKKKRGEACYTPSQLEFIARVEADLAVQLASKPKRLAHSLSVATTAETLALMYGVDPYLARIAGLLHDWDKVLPDDELIARAEALGLDFEGAAYKDVKPLLHGCVAARELPELYPELPDEVWHAISVHTTGGYEMGPLDKVLFVADGIEPLRPSSKGIEETRSLVGRVTLDDLFWNSFVGGIVYVLKGGRHLYEGTIRFYNALAAERSGSAR